MTINPRFQLSGVILLSCLAVGTANNYHNGYITWKLCEDIEQEGTKVPGFYDPAFPDVCSGKRGSVTCDPSGADCKRFVGATVHAAWNTMHDDDSLIPATEYQALLTSMGSTGGRPNYATPNCEYGRTCFVNVLRVVGTGSTGESSGQALEAAYKTRRIGFRLGRDSLGPMTDGDIVDCPVKGSTACDVNFYRFVVDRFSYDVEDIPGTTRYNYQDQYSQQNALDAASDPRFIYTHYSFEVELPVEQDVTIYFEGCCRPPIQRGDPTDVTGTANNMVNVFKSDCTSPGQICISNQLLDNTHSNYISYSSQSMGFYIFSELQAQLTEVYQGVGRRFPMSSINFASSNIVRAAPNGLSTCDNNFNLDSYTIPQRFLVGAYHAESVYHNTLEYKLGDVISRGGCASTADECTERCCSGSLLATQQFAGYAVIENPDVVESITTDLNGGVVTLFKSSFGQDGKSTEGNYAMNVVAEITVDPDNTPYRSNIDFVLQIIDSVEIESSNSEGNDAPAPFYHDDIILLRPSYFNPITMQCGRPTFTITDGTRTYSEDYLDIHYRDFDQLRTTGGGAGACQLVNANDQNIDLIDQTNSLPYGAQLQVIPEIVTASNNPNHNPGSHKKVKLTWSPKCEVRSDIGMFLMCFGARDDQDRPDITNDADKNVKILDNAFLIQTPQSFYPTSEFGWRTYSQCFDDDAIIQQSSCRSNPSCLFVRVDAFPENPRPQFVVTRADIEVSNTIEACNSEVAVPNCVLPGSVSDPGYCQGEQQSVAQGKNFEMTFYTIAENQYFQLEMNITFTCLTGCEPEVDPDRIVHPPVISDMMYGCNKIWKGPGMATGDDGTCSDTPTIQNHYDVGRRFEFSAPVRLSSRKTFLVCLQTFQIIPPEISLSEWNDLYGSAPNSDTCRTCFELQVVPGPTLEARDENGFPLTGEVPSVIAYVGIEKQFSLRAEGRLDQVEIMILADPGAPAHSELQSCNPCSAFDQETAKQVTERTFSFLPRVGQEGTKFRLRFMARNEDQSGSVLFSNPLEMEVTVMLFDVNWGLTEPCMPVPAGFPTVTTNSGDPPGICRSAGELTATVGCTQVHNLVAVLQASSGVNLGTEVITYSNFLNPEGFVMEVYPSCTGEFCPDVMSVESCSSGHIGVCCGNGVCDGAETGSNCPADCEPDDYSFTMANFDSNSPSSVRATLRYTPIQQQLGRTLLVCAMLSIQDSKGGSRVVNHVRTATTGPSLCIKMMVASCKYCVPQGKTLKSIARHYFLNVDWLRLYNSNPTIPDPDDLALEKEIFVGPQYTVQSGDTLLSIAAQMRTTVKSIMENNPFVPMDGMIRPGEKVCVLVCSIV